MQVHRMRRKESARCRRRHRRQAQSGFSLFELLVAMAVTVIGLLGLMSLHKTSIQGNQASARLIEATAVAQQTMEEIRALPIQSSDPAERTLLTLFVVPDLPILNGTLPPITGRDQTQYRRTVKAIELTGMSPDLVHIRIEIDWTDNGASPTDPDPRLHHSLVLEAIRTRQDPV